MNHAARLRKTGLIILCSGLALGGLIYLLFPESDPPDDNTLASQYYKHQQVETQRLWGGEGSLVLGLTRILKRASTYSVLIIGVSAIVALACFFWASHPPRMDRD